MTCLMQNIFKNGGRKNITPKSMRKNELQDWLTLQNIQWETEWLRPKLIEIVESHIDSIPIVQKMAENAGHKLLLL